MGRLGDTVRLASDGVEGIDVDVAGSAGFADAVVQVVAATRAGEVVTYGEVAAEAGRPGAARAVGRVMAQRGSGLPWWRVVTATGRLVPGLEAEHAARLAAEGIGCADGRVQPVGARARGRRTAGGR